MRGIDDEHLSSVGVELPPSYHQWWRFLVTIFLPHGIVDGTILNLLGLPICMIIERKIGWLRMVLVHATAGVVGHLVSVISCDWITSGILTLKRLPHSTSYGLSLDSTSFHAFWLVENAKHYGVTVQYNSSLIGFTKPKFYELLTFISPTLIAHEKIQL